MNRVYLIGRLAKDPEIRETPKGNSVCYFTLVVNNYTKNSDGTKRDAMFIPCVVWGKLAENFVLYNKKGASLAVDGKITIKEYVKKDGVKTRYTEVTCDMIHYLTNKSGDKDVDIEEEVLSEIENSYEDVLL